MPSNWEKYIVIVIGIFFLFSCQKENLPDGFLASSKRSNKNPVLEIFTGVECGWCVDGHEVAESLIDLYGNDIVVISIHAGPYADPSSDVPNFTSPYGNALIAQSDVSGYPNGTVNRVKYSIVQSDGLAMGRSKWENASSNISLHKSPVNIGAKATYHTTTQELIVHVDLYYREDGGGENKLNIAVLQDHIIGYQRGSEDVDNYEHNHVLRDFITGQWGDTVPAAFTSKKSQYSKTFSYTIPKDYNGPSIPPGGGKTFVDDMSLAIFVAKDHENIYTGINVDIEIQ